jgi:hypothetical protein
MMHSVTDKDMKISNNKLAIIWRFFTGAGVVLSFSVASKCFLDFNVFFNTSSTDYSLLSSSEESSLWISVDAAVLLNSKLPDPSST